MDIFVLQIKTGDEEKFLLAARRLLPDLEGTFCFPRRKLPTRKAGKMTIKEVPLFGGYLFYLCEEVTGHIISQLKTLPGYSRFLPSPDRILPLPEGEKRFIHTLISKGDLIGLSTVTFDIEGRISVKEGPLKGYEGKIIKVDKRKRRARIQLDLYKESFLLDFGFELLESVD